MDKELLAERFWKEKREEVFRILCPEGCKETCSVMAFGSGTTVRAIIKKAPKELRECPYIRFVSTSRDTTYSLPKPPLPYYVKPKLIIDGADSVLTSRNNYVIKGGGGALLKEKLLGYSADYVFIVVTPEKFDREFPVPVLTLPEAIRLLMRELLSLDFVKSVKVRSGGKLPPVVTEEGLAILDVETEDYRELYDALESLRPLVIEHGIFTYPKAKKYVVYG